MTTMNDATKMAVTLARKGASDEVIALVMEALTPAVATAAPEAVKPATPAPRPAPTVVAKPSKRPKGTRKRWFPLLNSLREIVKQRGPQRGDVRMLAEMCPPHILAAASTGYSVEYGPMVRGLGGIVSRHAKKGEALCGMRFHLLGHEVIRQERGGATAVYRVELA